MRDVDRSGISIPSDELPVRLDVPDVDAPVETSWGRVRLSFHLPGLSLLAAVAVWLMRRFIFTTGLPAGTDMLGFVSRAPQYASFSRIYDAWAPSSFGYRHVSNFDNIMGALTLLMRNPVATVTLIDVLTLFGAGVGAYALAWSWYRRRLAATVAGLLFMASQAVLTRFGSGLLNVEVIFSLAPVMFLTLSACLERFTLKRAIGFTLTIGLGLLVRPDLELYVFPFLVLYVVITLATRHGFGARARNLARTLAVSVPGVLLLNAAWLVPFVAGYRVSYQTLNQLFSLRSLHEHSLNWYQSLLGLGREIGYFNFTGAETWYSYPWLPQWGYYAFAASVPLLALAALWWHRDRRTVFLVLAAVIATLAGPGMNAPLGGLYLWAVQHVPVFGNLRDTNRWLLTQAIAYAVLAGLAVDHVATGAARLWSRPWQRDAGQPWPTAVRGAVAVILVGIALVSVLPTFVVGLRTWHVPPSQLALLDRLRVIPSAQRILSVPTQDTRFLQQGTYRGFEHDLGYESALFTGRQNVADGGWEQTSANFAAYQTTLLLHQDPAFSAMLGSVGVSRVLSLNYPLLKQVANPTTGVGPYSEQRAAAQTPKLTPILSNSAGTDYAIGNITSPLSFRRNVAVVLGGGQGAAALADQPGINLSDWAVFEAHDVIETGGYSQLLTLIRRADVVLLADERPLDIAVEGTAPIATFTGMTSSPQLDRLIAAQPADQSAQAGSLNDVSVPIPQPQTTSAGTVFSVRSPQRAEIWARVLVSGSAATIQTHLDGAKVGSITPVTLGHGFQWVQLATAQVGTGHHQVRISAVPSTFGDNYEVQQVRVLSPGALGSAEMQLNGALAAQAGRVAYAFDYADVAKWSWQSLAGSLAPRGAAFDMHGWAIPRRAGTATVTTAPGGGGTMQRVTVRPRRPVYTFAKMRYRTPQNWGNRPYFYLEFKGDDSGKVYQLVVDFGLGQKNEARYTFIDDSKAWKTLAFSTSNPGPGSGATDWSRIHSIRIALPSKEESGTLTLGLPRPSSPVNSFRVPVPVLPHTGKFTIASAKTPVCFRGFRAADTPQPLLSSGTLVIPGSDENSPCRISVAPRAGYQQLPAVPVSTRQTGAESWSYSFSAQQPGVLVWTQAYDPLWRLTGASGSTQFPELSVINGYLVGPGNHSGTIAFAGESSSIAGVLISLLTGLALVLAVVLRRNQAAKLLQLAATSQRKFRRSQCWPRSLRAVTVSLAHRVVRKCL
jgi:hypothetical protein